MCWPRAVGDRLCCAACRSPLLEPRLTCCTGHFLSNPFLSLSFTSRPSHIPPCVTHPHPHPRGASRADDRPQQPSRVNDLSLLFSCALSARPRAFPACGAVPFASYKKALFERDGVRDEMPLAGHGLAGGEAGAGCGLGQAWPTYRASSVLTMSRVLCAV
jgi:hypothetical protein